MCSKTFYLHMRFPVDVCEEIVLVLAILTTMVALERIILPMKPHVKRMHHKICEKNATVLTACEKATRFFHARRARLGAGWLGVFIVAIDYWFLGGIGAGHTADVTPRAIVTI